MILLIDNYDSFSYNLYQLVGCINPDIRVVRNNKITLEEIAIIRPERIILSPGPGRPEHAGICKEVIRMYSESIPILGICLGHQAICQEYGGKISYAKELMHGKQSTIEIDHTSKLFTGLPNQIQAARYHSLAAVEDFMPDCLQIIARTKDREIMAVKHKQYETYGLQFHPESILTPDGKQILENFLRA